MKPLAIFILLLAAFDLPTMAQTERKPNIILMVADDLGYRDLGCYGATKIATPRIDSLVKDGVRFTDAHSYSGICMPSRYTILSGRYAHRVTRSMDYACSFDDGQILLPAMLKTAGYRTAIIGKWHNGFGKKSIVDWNAELKPGPLEFGFDSYFGTPRTHSEPPLVFARDHWIVGIEKDDPISVDRGPGTGAHGKQIGGRKAMSLRPADKVDLMLADEAAGFLAAQKSSQPFFLYLAWAAPHNPIAPSSEFQSASKAGRYGDFIQQLDHAVGRVLDAVEKNNLSQNTLIIFTSDNGGRYEAAALRAGHRTNGELLGQKTDVWEGGHRVAFLARWPGRIPAATEQKGFFHHVDLMSTLAAAAGATIPAGASPDGHSELPAFLDPLKTAPARSEAVFHGTSGIAFRQGHWLYIPQRGSGGKTVPEPAKPWSLPYSIMQFENSDVDQRGQPKPSAPAEQLYDLASDISQKTNLASREPALMKTLRKRLDDLTVGYARKKKATADE